MRSLAILAYLPNLVKLAWYSPFKPIDLFVSLEMTFNLKPPLKTCTR
jgi:hypothetical protein